MRTGCGVEKPIHLCTSTLYGSRYSKSGNSLRPTVSRIRALRFLPPSTVRGESPQPDVPSTSRLKRLPRIISTLAPFWHSPPCSLLLCPPINGMGYSTHGCRMCDIYPCRETAAFQKRPPTQADVPSWSYAAAGATQCHTRQRSLPLAIPSIRQNHQLPIFCSTATPAHELPPIHISTRPSNPRSALTAPHEAQTRPISKPRRFRFARK